MTGLLTNDDPALRRCWHPIARVESLVDGPVPAELMGSRYVVAQLDGHVLVAEDGCPHRGARLSLGTVADGCLRCPYHGWRFAASGTCVAIPALGDSPLPPRADLAAVPHEVALGLVWIRPDHGRDRFAPLDVPEWDEAADGRIDAAWLPDVVVACSAGQFVDNFLDVGHFPVVHAGTFGADEADEVGELDVDRVGDDGIRLRHAHTIVNREDPLVDSGEHPLVQPRVMEYTVRGPFSARLRIDLPTTGVANTIVAIASPTSPTSTTLFTVLLRNDLDGPDAAQHAVDYEMSVLAEDLSILEHLVDPGLAIDLPAQVHTRADRFTVEYRRLLGRMLRPVDGSRSASRPSSDATPD